MGCLDWEGYKNTLLQELKCIKNLSKCNFLAVGKQKMVHPTCNFEASH